MLLATASRDARQFARHRDEHRVDPYTGIILPDQLLAARDAHVEPIHALMIAVLRDAIDCFRKHLLDHSRRGRRLFREAEAWLMAESAHTPLEFEGICEGLDLDPDYVRDRLSAWRARQLAQARTADAAHRRRPIPPRGGGRVRIIAMAR